MPLLDDSKYRTNPLLHLVQPSHCHPPTSALPLHAGMQVAFSTNTNTNRRCSYTDGTMPDLGQSYLCIVQTYLDF